MLKQTLKKWVQKQEPKRKIKKDVAFYVPCVDTTFTFLLKWSTVIVLQ